MSFLGQQGALLLFIRFAGLFIVVASLNAEHRFQSAGLVSWGSVAVPQNRHLYRPGTEATSHSTGNLRHGPTREVVSTPLLCFV